MTTAARPTWAPAKGGQEQGGTRIFGPSQKFSSRDLAAHTTLKARDIMSLPRWKGNGFSDIAHAFPMSMIIKELKASLLQSKTLANLSGSHVLLEVDLQLADLLDRACFGQPFSTSVKDKQWYQLGLEEAFYLSHHLKCFTVVGEDQKPKMNNELWEYMTTQINEFPLLYKAYSHLRNKNWIVRPGLQYGVDYVAYQHHHALVHSEYAVLVIPEGDIGHPRMKLWSDWQCVLRVTGGVAKSLLVLSITERNCTPSSLSSLEQYTVKEHMIKRWVPELFREENSLDNVTPQSVKEFNSEEPIVVQQETTQI